MKTMKSHKLSIASGLCAMLLAATMLTGCGKKEPCSYCGDETSKKYKLHDGSYDYVCKDCSSECFFCGKKATKHYESYLGIIFVCKDCYDDIVELNS